MSIRFLGGQIGEALNENHLYKMRDIVGVEIKDLIKMFNGVVFNVSRFLTNDVEKAQWLKALAVGICMEECAEKGPPASVGGCKTFKKAENFKELEKYIGLVVIDIIHKIHETMEDFQIYPQQYVVMYRDKTNSTKNKSQRYPILPYHQFMENPRKLIDFVKPLYKEHEKFLFPCTMIAASVANFRSVEDIKKEQGSTLTKFFTKGPVTKAPIKPPTNRNGKMITKTI